MKDCKDESDEVSCKSLSIPDFYDKAKPPEMPRNLEKANPMNIRVTIKNVDFVNTISMSVGLTIELRVSWKDFQLTYFNLIDNEGWFNESKRVDAAVYDQLWLPIPMIEHDNAVIGNTKEDKTKYVQIQPDNNPLPISPVLATEDLIFPGPQNDLIMIQKFKLEYLCNFHLPKFPFDFLTRIRVPKNKSVMFVDEAVVYKGPKVLAEFQVNKITYKASLEHKETSFTYSVGFNRLYTSHLTSIYFQTFLMWFLAYLTLFIEIEDFSNRFMGMVTALLVLVALLASIADKLPQTSYFKYIDLWFTFYIINIISLIMFTIFVDLVLKQEDPLFVSQKVVNQQVGVKPESKRKRALKYNNVAKILFPVIVAIFSILYFFLSTI